MEMVSRQICRVHCVPLCTTSKIISFSFFHLRISFIAMLIGFILCFVSLDVCTSYTPKNLINPCFNSQIDKEKYKRFLFLYYVTSVFFTSFFASTSTNENQKKNIETVIYYTKEMNHSCGILYN